MDYVRTLRNKNQVFPFWQIDGSGNVRCTLDPEYKPSERISGKRKKYQQVQLLHKSTLRWYYVHRLVAYSWMEQPHQLMSIVDHKDGDALNNRVENLRFVTRLANNLNRRDRNIFSRDGYFVPRICGYEHSRFQSTDIQTVELCRDLLLECYVRYNCKYPENGNCFPHKYITNY